MEMDVSGLALSISRRRRTYQARRDTGGSADTCVSSCISISNLAAASTSLVALSMASVTLGKQRGSCGIIFIVPTYHSFCLCMASNISSSKSCST